MKKMEKWKKGKKENIKRDSFVIASLWLAMTLKLHVLGK
jgi:hypothetical protein